MPCISGLLILKYLHTNIRIMLNNCERSIALICLKYNISYDVHLLNVPYVGKVFSGKILANLTNGVQFTNFSLPISTDQYNKITEDLPVDSPKFLPSEISHA